MPEKSTERALKSYELSSVILLLATVLCGIALVLRPSLLQWAVGLFIGLMTLSGTLGAYLLVQHAYHDPRFKSATLLNWTALTVFVLALLWVQYGV